MSLIPLINRKLFIKDRPKKFLGLCRSPHLVLLYNLPLKVTSLYCTENLFQHILTQPARLDQHACDSIGEALIRNYTTNCYKYDPNSAKFRQTTIWIMNHLRMKGTGALFLISLFLMVVFPTFIIPTLQYS